MKNNVLILAVIGVAAVAAVGGYLFMQSSGDTPLSMEKDPVKSMEQAIMGSGSVKCEYTDEEGREITTYVKNGMIRSEFTDENAEPGGMIFKDNTMWTWNSTTKEGVTMVLPESDESAESAESEENDFGGNPVADKEELEAEIEKYKEQCKSENIADSMFDAPGDITFQDMSDFYKNLPQMPQQ